MARFRLSAPAQADLANILATSLERWGRDGRSRYASLLSAALRTVAVDPAGPTTIAREDLPRGIRSFHLRHVRGDHGVRTPVHVIFYRVIRPDLLEIVRVLHERMDPIRHVEEPPKASKAPRSRRR